MSTIHCFSCFSVVFSCFSSGYDVWFQNKPKCHGADMTGMSWLIRGWITFGSCLSAELRSLLCCSGVLVDLVSLQKDSHLLICETVHFCQAVVLVYHTGCSSKLLTDIMHKVSCQVIFINVSQSSVYKSDEGNTVSLRQASARHIIWHHCKMESCIFNVKQG